MTATRLPVKSGMVPSPMARSILPTADMTPRESSPSMPTFLSVWAPMEM